MHAWPFAALFLATLAPAGALAQGSRFPAPRVDLGDDVYDSTVVDIDADGWADLVAGAGGLAIRRGFGDGTFGPLEKFTSGTSPQGLTIIDIDLDGDLDVVACRSSTGTGPNDLIVVKQKSDHNFGPVASYSAITWPTETAAGDIDGNGWPDVVVTSTNISLTASQVQVRLATAPGVLGAATTIPLALGAGDVVLADFDGDGALDLAAEGSHSSTVSVCLGDGAGGFSPFVAVPIDSLSRSIQAADLDADGALDLVIGRQDSQGDFNILYGIGDGGFDPYVPIQSGFIYPNEVAIADLSRDGILDLAIAAGYRISLVFGLGGRDYAEPVLNTGASVLHSAIAVADLDLDGWLDIVADNLWSRDATVLLADGGAAFASAGLYDGPSTFYPGIAVADFDGDGALDVFATNEWDDTATTWLGLGDGTFVAGPALAVPDVAWNAQPGLLDGDGILDLLLLDRTTNSAFVYLGQGDGSFVAGQVIGSGGDRPRDAALADLDGDGDLDAVVANETPRTVQLLLGAGDGSFAAGALLGPFEGQNLRNLELGDITGDGHLDLVLGSFTGGTWRLLPGDGAGGFTTPGSILIAGSSIKDIQLADVNADGRLDVLESDYYDNSLLVCLNTGDASDGYCDLQVVVALPPADSGPSTLAVADYDLDGHADVAVGQGGSLRIDLLFGSGDGTFSPNESYGADETAEFVRTGDWNGDGASDLLTVAQSISVLLNRTLAPWQSLGHGSPGIDGIPWLRGEGATSAGGAITLRLDFAEDLAPVTLVVGLSALQAPFKGGWLVPAPDLVLIGLVTDATGSLTLPGTWPAGVPDLALHLQAWLEDATAPFGLAASGAVRASGF